MKKNAGSPLVFLSGIIILVLGLIMLLELRGGGVFGGTTAGILSSIGGVFGLIESTKKQKF